MTIIIGSLYVWHRKQKCACFNKINYTILTFFLLFFFIDSCRTLCTFKLIKINTKFSKVRIAPNWRVCESQLYRVSKLRKPDRHFPVRLAQVQPCHWVASQDPLFQHFLSNKPILFWHLPHRIMLPSIGVLHRLVLRPQKVSSTPSALVDFCATLLVRHIQTHPYLLHFTSPRPIVITFNLSHV